MLDFPLLQTLVHPEFETFLVGGHLIRLFLHKFSLRSQDLLVPRVVVLLPLLLLELLYAALHLVSFLVVLLLRQILLDPLQVEQLCRPLERIGFLLERPPIVF